jgi:hypothetical protein
MNKPFILTQLLCCCFIVLISACTTAEPANEMVYTQVTEATLAGGDAIPVPSADVIVTITGNIGTSNVGDSIQMDLATIESAGLVDYTLNDPFENREVTYRGVVMSDLLDIWQVGEDATILHMVALNDYAVDVPLADLREYPVIFALQADGAYMPIATRGPAMLVYPYDDFEFDTAIYNDYWIWQIKAIEVR